MVTVALGMHIIMQGGVHPQGAGACHPLSLSTGAGHPAAHVLVHLHFPHLLSSLCLCSCSTRVGVVWVWLSLTRTGKGRNPGCSQPLPVELIADSRSGAAAYPWELCARWDVSLGLGGVCPTGLMSRQAPGRKCRKIPKP